MTNYQENGEFSLESFSSDYNTIRYSCCEEPYPDITYIIRYLAPHNHPTSSDHCCFFRLRRRPMFYVFNLILPCVLINGIGKDQQSSDNS